MRVKISEKNIFPTFDLYYEYEKIEKAFSQKPIIYRSGDNYNIEAFLNKFCFLDWNLRGTFFTVYEMREALGIEQSKFARNTINEELVLDFIQYACNCVCRVNTYISLISKKVNCYWLDKSFSKALIDNMKQLILKLNCVLEIDDTNEIFIDYNDDVASVVGEDYPDISGSITEYRRIDNRGNLQRKAEILCTLYKKLESVEGKLKANNFGNIMSDASFLFNKTGIRHWQSGVKESSKKFVDMPAGELEGWYDRAFNLFLTCMVLSTYIDNKDDVSEMRKSSVHISE